MLTVDFKEGASSGVMTAPAIPAKAAKCGGGGGGGTKKSAAGVKW